MSLPILGMVMCIVIIGIMVKQVLNKQRKVFKKVYYLINILIHIYSIKELYISYTKYNKLYQKFRQCMKTSKVQNILIWIQILLINK